jgi:CspA family cold shock protein
MMKGRDFDQPVITQEEVAAVVKWFNPVKGFGFVQPSDGSPDAFLHISVVEQTGHRDLPEGTKVTCSIAEGRKGPQVAAILSVDELAEAPARSGGSAGYGGGYGGGGGVVEGTVKFFNPEKGFGFVTPDDGGKDVFVSSRTLERIGLSTLESNQRVRLTTRMGQKGPMAENVEII